MNRQEIIRKIQNDLNCAYMLKDREKVDEIISETFDNVANLCHPVTLAEFLGWEEGVEYRRGGNIFKVEGNHLLDRRPNGHWENTNCQTWELIDLREATRIPCEKYYAKIKGYELVGDEMIYWALRERFNTLEINEKDTLDYITNKMTLEEWNKLGINDTNAYFEEIK